VLTSIRPLTRLAVLALTTVAPAIANAGTIITGTFTGTSTNTQIFTPPFGNFDGTAASGSFRLDLTGCVAFPPQPQSCQAFSGSAPENSKSYLKLTTIEGDAKFFGPEVLAVVANTPTSQSLTLNFAFQDPYSNTSLTLVGAPNAFLHGTDFSHLFPGAIDLGQSSLSYQLGRDYRGSVKLSSLTVALVPEPGAWLLLATMTGATLTLRRRTKAR